MGEDDQDNLLVDSVLLLRHDCIHLAPFFHEVDECFQLVHEMLAQCFQVVRATLRRRLEWLARRRWWLERRLVSFRRVRLRVFLESKENGEIVVEADIEEEGKRLEADLFLLVEFHKVDEVVVQVEDSSDILEDILADGASRILFELHYYLHGGSHRDCLRWEVAERYADLIAWMMFFVLDVLIAADHEHVFGVDNFD